jgi:hypothetical protein
MELFDRDDVMHLVAPVSPSSAKAETGTSFVSRALSI